MQNNHLPAEIVISAPTPVLASPLASYAGLEEQGLHLRDYWYVLAKRKGWFLGIFLLMTAAAVLVTLFMTPIYKVTATLQIVQDNPSALLGGSGSDPLGALTGSTELDRFYETQYNVLQSPAIANGLIDSLKLTEHPSYKQMAADNPDLPPEGIRQKYTEYLLEHLKIEPVKDSYLVNVSFRSTDKELARQVPEAIQKEYLKLSMLTRQQSYAMLREWLDGELTRLGKKLETSEQNLYANGQAQEFLSLEDPGTNVTIQKYIDVSKLLTTAQADRAAKEAQYRQITERGADAPLITNHSLITQLRQQLIDVESQVSGNSRIFGSNYPEHQAQTARMKELRERLNQEVKRLSTSIKSDYEAAARAEKLIQGEYDAQKTRVVDMQNGLVRHHILKRDLQTNQTLYEGLLARMKEASVASTMVASNVSVIAAPEIPYKPWMPRPVLFILLGSGLGFVFGLIAAFFVEYLDNSIKTSEELEKLCRLPVLGVVPLADLREFKGKTPALELATYTDPMTMLSESIFHIRTALMLSASASPPQVIAVSSANPGEGKTTISSNIAVGLSGKDRKCIILDCDLRKPRLHRVYNSSPYPGLTNYLTGNASLEDIVRETQVPNLYFIPAGPTPPNPNELLASEMFRDLVDELRQQYRHIVIDAPPVIGFADVRTISASADGVVLVFRHHSTTREAGQLAMHLLSQNNCRILGGIMSMARTDRLGYGGYYGYYHNYKKDYASYRRGAEGNLPQSRNLVR